MGDERWRPEDSSGYREKTDRAVREAQELYRRGEEYKARHHSKDEKLIQALQRLPVSSEKTVTASAWPEKEDERWRRESGKEVPPLPQEAPKERQEGGGPEEASCLTGKGQEGPASRWDGKSQAAPAPGPSRETKEEKKYRNPIPERRTAKGQGSLGKEEETFLLLLLLFLLWREKASPEILLALLYILLV